MKKYLGLLLAITMVFSMAFVMSACGETTESTVNATLPEDVFDEKVPSKDIEKKVDDLEQMIKDGISSDEQKEHFQSDAKYIVANLPGADTVLGEYIEQEGKEPKTSYEDIDINKLREQTEQYKETEATQATEESSEETTESQSTAESTHGDTTKPTAIELPKVKLK